MTRPTDAAATALAQLVGQIAQSLRAGDDAAARAQAATQVEQLRAIVAQTPQTQATASPLFDLAQISKAMHVFTK